MASSDRSKDDQIPLFVAVAFIVGIFAGVGALVGVVLAYLKRDDYRGTWADSVLTYFIRTFWITLGLGVLFVALTFVAIGIPLLILLGIWYIVRTVRGSLAAFERRPIANPETWFV